MIRKEGFVAPAVLEELKRIIEDSEVGTSHLPLSANTKVRYDLCRYY